MDIREIIREEVSKILNEEYVDGDLYGYHVTSKSSLDKISNDGFKIGSGRMQGKGVYAFYLIKDALLYGGKGNVPTVGDGVAIVKFKITNPSSMLILNMKIAKDVFGSEYGLKNQIDKKYWGFGKGLEGLLKLIRVSINKDLTMEGLIKILDKIENNNSEMNQRTFWSSLIPSTESDSLNLLHNGNYGIEYRINNPSLMLPVGYYNLGLDGLSDFTEFSKSRNIPDTEEYDEIRKHVEKTGEDLVAFKKRLEDKMYATRNNKEFDHYSNLIDKIEKTLSNSKEIDEIDLSVGGHGLKPGGGRKFPASDTEGGHSLNLSVSDGPHQFPYEEKF